MSNKALRHFLENNGPDSKGPDLDKQAEDEEESEEDDEAPAPVASSSKKKRNQKKKKANNRFNMFDLLNENAAKSDEEDEVEKSDENADIEGLPTEEKDSVTVTKPSTKAKKKRKKKGKANGNADDCDRPQSEPTDEIEASLQEVNHLLGDPCAMSAGADVKNPMASSPLLVVDYRNLNPENELKRIFGADVVRGERPVLRGRRKVQTNRRGYKLVQPKEGWHSASGSGLSMVNLGGDQGFAFVHSSTYQDTQYLYRDAVQSGNPENIFNILRSHPYHIDTLIQLAEFYRMNEDQRTAAEIVEKSLFGLENAFDIMFNMASGNCLLEYKRQENRALHICLFKHILNVGNRGCYRTAFEFCKLLLSLDRKVDPLNTMYLIDFYAIRSSQYDFLIRLWHETRDSPSSILERVNFALSVPLALFHTASSKKADTTEADELLQDRLLMYPVVLKSLLDKCGVQPDKTVDTHPFFNSNELHNEKSELGRVVKMVVERSFPCWKEPDVMAWLERNVQDVLKIVDKGQDPRISLYATRREARFKGASHCLLRHYLLCEITGLGMPRSVHNLDPDQLMVTDPFPPADTITVYTADRARPNPSARRGQDARQQRNMLGLLLESLLPTYDQNAPPAENMVAAGGDGAEEGARAIPNQIQHSVNAIMDAMRALLTDLRGPDDIPAAPDAAMMDGEDNERDWEEEQEEFDQRRQ